MSQRDNQPLQFRASIPWLGMGSKCGESKSFLAESSHEPNICLKLGKAQLALELTVFPISFGEAEKTKWGEGERFEPLAGARAAVVAAAPQGFSPSVHPESLHVAHCCL